MAFAGTGKSAEFGDSPSIVDRRGRERWFVFGEVFPPTGVFEAHGATPAGVCLRAPRNPPPQSSSGSLCTSHEAVARLMTLENVELREAPGRFEAI